MTTALSVRHLSVPRNGFDIVRDVTLDVPFGEITVLAGANGAGKTTLLEGIAGIVPSSGTVALGHQALGKASPAARAQAGLCLVEQGRPVFSDLTVQQNFEVVSADRQRIAETYDLFPELVERRDSRSSLLSGGEQQMLVLARALLTDPNCILLDEMSFGLAPILVQRLMPVVRRIADQGAAVLLVEQFAHLALAIGDQAVVLNHGELVLQDSCAALIADPDRLKSAYLGV